MPENSPILDYQTPPPKAPLFRWYIVYPLLGLVAIAFLLAAIVPSLENHPPGTKRRMTIANLANLRTALDVFHSDTGCYPATAEGLAALLTQPPGLAGWKGPYVNRLPLDEWGTPYRYACPAATPGRPFDLSSAGPDRTFGTADDLTCNSDP